MRKNIENKSWLAKLVNKWLHVEPNPTFDEATKACTKQINEADRFVYIVAGELEKDAYTKPDLINALKNAAKKPNIDIKIIYGPDADQESVNALKEITGITLYKAQKRPPAHYIVTDKSVRIEDFHLPREKYRRAFTIRPSKYLSERMQREFRTLLYKMPHPDTHN